MLREQDEPLSSDQMIACFNEWMRRFIETPEQFAREFEAVAAFLRDTADGHEPTYGQQATAYMQQVAREIDAGD